jgi:predicted NBD/HSP70 family sugar kinase
MMTRGRSTTRQRRPAIAAKDGPGISHSDIADHNSRAVLEILRVAGPLTRRELSARVGLTEPAITGILRRLQDDGLVASRRQSNANRYPSTEFLIRRNGAVAVGIRLLPTRAELLLINLAGETLAERHDIPAAEAAMAALALAQDKPAGARLIGIGLVSAPSLVVDVEALRQTLAPLPLVFSPDTAAAVTAERLYGYGELDGSLVSLILAEDGVRAGLSIAGRPFSGRHGFAGSIGAMHTGRDRASLSERVSVSALTERLRRAEADGVAATEAAADWAGEAASHLLDAAVAISGLLAPGMLVVGGDLPADIVDMVIAQMERERLDKASRPMASPWMPPIRSSRLPAAGITTGAALLPFLEFLLPNPQPAREASSAQVAAASASG